jgi:hypothetical protein
MMVLCEATGFKCEHVLKPVFEWHYSVPELPMPSNRVYVPGV